MKLQTTYTLTIVFIFLNSKGFSQILTPISHMNEYRESHVMAPIPNGVLSIGGFDGSNTLSTVEMYNEEFDEWYYTSELPQPKQDATAHTIDGKIFLFGGSDLNSNSYFSDILEYSIENETWEIVGQMSNSRAGHSSIVTDYGVLICGGYDGTEDLSSCDIFNPNTYDITPTQPMSIARSSFAMMSIEDADIPSSNTPVIVAGGYNPNQGYQLSSCELFYNESWSTLSDIPWAVDNLAGVTAYSNELGGIPIISGGRIYNPEENLFQGIDEGAVFSSITEEWIAFDLSQPYSYHRMASTIWSGQSYLFIFGGANETGIGVETTYSNGESGILGGAFPNTTFENTETTELGGRFKAAHCKAYSSTNYYHLIDQGYVSGGDHDNTGTAFKYDFQGINHVHDSSDIYADLKVYPNPAVGRIAIPQIDSITSWVLFDVKGEIVLSGKGQTCDVTNVIPGKYTILTEHGARSSIVVTGL